MCINERIKPCRVHVLTKQCALFVKYLLATCGFKLQHERSEPSQECVMFEMALHCEVLHVRVARETCVHSLWICFLIPG